jgi:hypothetical protein
MTTSDDRLHALVTGRNVRTELALEVRAALNKLACITAHGKNNQLVLEAVRDDLRAAIEGDPQDDGEAVTEDWLRSLGRRQRDCEAGLWVVATDGSRFDVEYWPKDESLRLYASNLCPDGTLSMGGTNIVCHKPTRGDVRRLCSVLRLPFEG